jgi:tetratricopeptide (TPR) repeat protein
MGGCAAAGPQRDYEQSAACYQHAIELYRETSDQHNEADTLASLGETYLAAGRPGDAHAAWLQALGILDQLGHPDAARIRNLIASL